jgi:hypothetical protein
MKLFSYVAGVEQIGSLRFLNGNYSFGGLDTYYDGVNSGCRMYYNFGEFELYGSGNMGWSFNTLVDPVTPSNTASYGMIWIGSFSTVQFSLQLSSGASLPIGSDLIPYGPQDIGTTSNRWDNIYGTNIYCTNQVVGKTITGDILFRHKGKEVFRIDENAEFLNFYNEDGRLIMKLGKDGTIYAKDIKKI